ncbi:MAG: SufD family Fe-S cluster assembly protein [Candidatus Odinarchaeota archaeon]
MSKDESLFNNYNSNKEINFDDYDFSVLRSNLCPIKNSIGDLNNTEINDLSSVGVLLNNKNRSGTYLLCDQDGLLNINTDIGIECLQIKEALEKYPMIREKYWFKSLNRDKDRYTNIVGSTIPRGFFIRVKKGMKVELPFQAGLYMSQENSAMSVHNIIVLEENAELHLITGCTNQHNLRKGVHLAISENYIGKNAFLINTMVHNWGPEFEIRPRTATIVEEKGTYISNYCSLSTGKSIQMNPFTYLKGKNSTAKYTTIILSTPGTFTDSSGTILMTGESSRAEIAARVVCQGGTIIQSGLLIGAAPYCRAHVDCSGLMLSDDGSIEAVPGLRAMHPDARMSHEASIGRIAPGEVAYLQSKGMTEEEAISMIIRGFLDMGVKGLSPDLDDSFSKIALVSGHGEK